MCLFVCVCAVIKVLFYIRFIIFNLIITKKVFSGARRSEKASFTVIEKLVSVILAEKH